MSYDIVKRIVFSIALGVAMAASAAPFDMWLEARLTDGRTIKIHGVGDEYAARFTDEEGRNLVYNPQAGAYEYAEREDDETFRRRAIERRLKDEEESGLARRWAAMKARRHKKTSSKPMLTAPPESETHGRIVGVTLLVDFPALDDHGNATTLSQLVHPGVTATDLDNLINGTNFRKYGPSANTSPMLRAVTWTTRTSSSAGSRCHIRVNTTTFPLTVTAIADVGSSATCLTSSRTPRNIRRSSGRPRRMPKAISSR